MKGRVKGAPPKGRDALANILSAGNCMYAVQRPKLKRQPTQPRKGGRPPQDARHTEAQKLLRQASQERAEKQRSHPDRHRANSGFFTLDWLKTNFGHAIGMALGMTFAGLAATWLYSMRHVNLVLARVIAMPTGLICAAVASYVSAYYLAAIETTFEGGDEVERLPAVEWREWFWTLPSTSGMFVAAGMVGFGAGYLLPVLKWLLAIPAIFWLYPLFQLSVLETGSPFLFISPMVAKTLASHTKD